MKIYVDSSLSSLKIYLKQRGYSLQDEIYSDTEAIVCDLKNDNSCSLDYVKALSNDKGPLIIDSGSKSDEDIDYILKTRHSNYIF
ncbi:YkuS family protein [Clostridium hydrogeniformans]|uniref:YkuS family protein n=1 Tax=Clostridium hydrogeniformans TaxID=349933 RepID=UPI0004881FE0|nr:YkuS family protein [Clostridium hydrogeniformans]